MPTTKTILLYTFDELEERAKERARDWFREADLFSDYVSYDDFIEICTAMGVQVGTLPRKARNGNVYQEPQIRWSGFSSQGDGASFAGRYASTGKAGESIRAYAGQDEKLHAIGDSLDLLAAKYPNGITADITLPHGGNYVHEYAMQVDGMTTDSEGEEVNLPDDDDKALTELMRDLARWFYRNLNEEYDYRNSDEEVDESIRINEYTFTGDGKRED